MGLTIGYEISMSTPTEIDRHDGPPLRTLEDVRRTHNVVGAFPDIEAARAAILALEQAGTEPRAISLLGAWPDHDRHRSPVIMYRRMTVATLLGATVAGMLGFAVFGGSWMWAIAGAIVGGTIGAITGWALAMGVSPAWQETFMVDEDGTVAVGVHSEDPDEISRARSALEAAEALALNEFGSDPGTRTS